MGSKARKARDARTSIKINTALYRVILREIRAHPEWGMGSVSEFVRRAIDHELSARRIHLDRRTVEIVLSGLSGNMDSQDRGR